MKWLITVMISLAASTASADDSDFFTFSNEDAPNAGDVYTTAGGCTAYRQPKLPAKMLNGAPENRILRSIYIHQVAASIEEAGGTCSCAIRFPTWDAAVADYQDRFSGLQDDERAAWVGEYAYEARSRMTRQVNAICDAVGVR